MNNQKIIKLNIGNQKRDGILDWHYKRVMKNHITKRISRKNILITFTNLNNQYSINSYKYIQKNRTHKYLINLMQNISIIHKLTNPKKNTIINKLYAIDLKQPIQKNNADKPS